MPGDPFQIDRLPNAPLGAAGVALARPLLSWVLRLRAYRAIYQQMLAAPGDTPFETRALDALEIQTACPPADLASVPTSGSLLIASNHPHGALDGLLLSSVLRQVRPDVRILTNHLLARIPELAPLCFFVDPFDGPAAAARSQAGLRAAYVWLRRGGALIVFPAGEVAHTLRSSGSYQDSPWRSTAGRMALSTGAQVVPAFIAGTNTKWFYAAGRLHASLRTVLLARELLNQRGQQVTMRLGAPMLARGCSGRGEDAAAATRLIRAAAERLAPENQIARAGASRADAVALDIARLPAEACLVESGAFQVFCAPAEQIPSALREIGRLREVTYQVVGEGSGRRLDLDEFDERYLHLFSWDREKRKIVGAYRVGQTDRIAAAQGPEGLYTRTLFQYDHRLIARLSPALELGRSFIRAEYQKHYSALLLLWKGIGQFVVRHPEYRVLFGLVSISARYSDSSHRLLISFLEQNHLDRDLADLVGAINPYAPIAAPSGAIPQSIDEANRLVTEAEADGKGVPVLLRQYLKLNARLLGFNIDPAFGDALDALMMVDLTAVEPAILNRYLGRAGAARFLARHRGRQSTHAA